MSTIEAAAIVAVFLTLSLGGTYAVLRWAMPSESVRDRIIRESYERADDAAVLDDLELAWDMDAYDPHLDAGCDRLRKAIRDEQQKGEL